MKLTPEKKLIVTIVVFSIIPLAIVFGVIFPAYKAIRQEQTRMNEVRAFMEKRFERTLHLRESLKKLNEIQRHSGEYLNRNFAPGDEMKLITLLESIAANNSITQKITHSNLDNIIDNKITIGINASGDYKNIIRYLLDLEKMSYFMNINQLQLTQLTDRMAPNVTNNATANLELSLYVNK